MEITMKNFQKSMNFLAMLWFGGIGSELSVGAFLFVDGNIDLSTY